MILSPDTKVAEVFDILYKETYFPTKSESGHFDRRRDTGLLGITAVSSVVVIRIK